jgi:hypothetical protein
MVLLLVSCSKKEDKPAKPAVPAPPKALINVVHDAVKSYAAGNLNFQGQRGIAISTRKITRTEKGTQVEYVEIRGLEQRGTTLAAITFLVPATWLTSEKEKLAGLDAEMRDLTACAQKLKDKGDNLEPDPTDSCKVLEITADGAPGIVITDGKVKHIQMQMFPVKQ